jgi:hypothetical protein
MKAIKIMYITQLVSQFAVALIAVVFFSCQKEQVPEPTDPNCNDFCKCGEVVFAHTYNWDTQMYRFEVKNNCSGVVKLIEYPTHKPMGSNLCVDYCW